MKRTSWIAILIAFLGMIGAFWIEDTIFERLPQLEDEIAYIYQAKIFAGGQAYIERQEPPHAYWQPFIIDCKGNYSKYEELDCADRRFGKYPPGWPLLLAPGYIFNLAWAINPLFFFLTIVLTYRLGREIYGEAAGVIAALLMASSPIALLQSGTLMAHTSTLFFVTLALYGLWRIEKGRRALFWGAIAGLGLGITVAIRPLTGVTLAMPLVAYSGLRVGVALIGELQLFWNIKRTPQWLRFLIFYIPLLMAVGVALWITWQIDYWPSWPVLLIGGILAVLITITVAFEVGAKNTPVNPPWPKRLIPMLIPLLAVAIFAAAFGALWPWFNYATTGDPQQNLYELVWDYDTLGFGEGHGRYKGEEASGFENGLGWGYHTEPGHNWKRAKNTLRKDLACYSRDLFGWVMQPDDSPETPTNRSGCMVPTEKRDGLTTVRGDTGLSWILLPIALIVGWRRRWTYLLFITTVVMIAVTMWYWIGAAVFSARYYYEVGSMLAILSAAGVVGIANWLRPLRLHAGLYLVVVILVGFSLMSYTPGRIEGLYRYGRLGQQQIDAVDQWRTDLDRPVLIIAIGSMSWRDVGALMALTSPYLDSEYVLVRDPNNENVDVLLAMFPDREVVYYIDGEYVPALVGWQPAPDESTVQATP